MMKQEFPSTSQPPSITMAITSRVVPGGIAPGFYDGDPNGGRDADVLISVTPPPQMPATLAQGTLAGYCVGEPWNQQAVAQFPKLVPIQVVDVAAHQLGGRRRARLHAVAPQLGEHIGAIAVDRHGWHTAAACCCASAMSGGVAFRGSRPHDESMT